MSSKRKQAKGFISGAGTSTSDSIPATAQEGTFIMPADSTEAIGAEALGKMGRGFRPVQVSNGEYGLPPEQVHAVGAQALAELRDATHQKVTDPFHEPNGERFADGGLVLPDESGPRRILYGDSAGNISERLPSRELVPVRQPATPAAPVATPAAPATPTAPQSTPAKGFSLGRLGSLAPKIAAPVSATVAAAGEVGDVAEVASNPRTSKADVVNQVAEGTAKTAGTLAGAALGAQGGAALGAMTGPFAPVAVPVLGTVGAVGGGFLGKEGVEKAVETGRRWVGADPRSPAEQQRGEAVENSGGFIPEYRADGFGHRFASTARGTIDDVSRDFGQGQYAKGVGSLVRGGLATTLGGALDAGEAVLSPVARFGKGLFGIEDAPPEAQQQAANQATGQATAQTPLGTQSIQPSEINATSAQPESGFRNTSVDGIVGRKDANGRYSFSNRSEDVDSATGQLTMPGRAARGGFSVMGEGDGAGGMERNLRAAAIYQQMREDAQREREARKLREPVVIHQRDDSANRANEIESAILKAATTRPRGFERGQLTRAQLDALAEAQRARDARAGNGNAAPRNRQAAALTAGSAAQSPSARTAALAEDVRTRRLQQAGIVSGSGGGGRGASGFTVLAGGQKYDPVSNQLVNMPAAAIDNATREIIYQKPPIRRTPIVGEIINGREYLGGDPSLPESYGARAN